MLFYQNNFNPGSNYDAKMISLWEVIRIGAVRLFQGQYLTQHNQ